MAIPGNETVEVRVPGVGVYSFIPTNLTVDSDGYGRDKIRVDGYIPSGPRVFTPEKDSGYCDSADVFEGSSRTAELVQAASMHLDLLDAARLEELKRLAIIKSLPESDDWADEAVLSITKTFKGNDKRYLYVALKVAGLWFITGTVGVQPGMTWAKLVDFILKDIDSVPEIYQVSGWEEIKNS